MRCIAIDFETALGFKAVYQNEPVQAACAVGVAEATLGREPMLLFRALIRPEPFEMDGGAFAVHGITLTQLESAPTFQQIWNEGFGELLNSADILVAHNMPFDCRVLIQALKATGIAYRSWKTFDTLAAARKYLPICHHSLQDCCDHIGFSINHHEAGSDAMGCAALFQTLCRQGNVHEFGVLG